VKIACISTSRIPSDTANSIQVMKACQALASLGHDGADFRAGGCGCPSALRKGRSWLSATA
jgi:hypothetical protein